MQVYDKATVVAEVRRVVPEVEGIAVTGSAAFEGREFRLDSDIDIVAIGPRNCFAWGEVQGRELEIHVYSPERLRNVILNPQWHGAGWVWLAGKIGAAEVLRGPPLEPLVRSLITARIRLVAGAALIGFLLLADEKARTGRRPSSLDVPLALSALRHVARDALPLRTEADRDLQDRVAAIDLESELQVARRLGEESYDLLRDDGEVGQIMYFPEHRAGLRWLRRAMGIHLEMPSLCLHR